MPKKQKSGLYRTKVKIGVDADGKPMYKYLSARTRDELAQARQTAIEYYITGVGIESDRLFGDYAVEWFRVRKEPFISASSRSSYRTALNKHILPVFAGRNLRAIKPVELQEFVNRYAGKSATQITIILATLCGIYRAALQDRLVAYNPTATLIRPDATPAAEKRALTPEERQRMQAIFPTHPDGLYLATLYYTGMRPGEALGLKWSDIDWRAGQIHITRDIDYAAGGVAGDLKTARARRLVPIAKPLRDLLASRRQLATAYIFPGVDGKPLSSGAVRRMWLRLMVACDLVEPIPPDERPAYFTKGDIRGQVRALITPHTLRHNFITMCWETGMDILLCQKIVGHAEFQTTRDIYTHLSNAHLDKARDSLDAMFSAPATDAGARSV